MSDTNTGLAERTDGGGQTATERPLAERKMRKAAEPATPRRLRGNRHYRYLQENRLQRVIAAITVLGLSHEYRRPARDWVYRLTGVRPDEQTAEETQVWRDVFVEHTEFFRESTTNRDNFSLILRRVVDKNEGQRPPINEEIMKMLIYTAISLHGKQFNQRADRRWVLTLLVPFFGSLIGAISGLLLKQGLL